jgi:hypothetical protein
MEIVAYGFSVSLNSLRLRKIGNWNNATDISDIIPLWNQWEFNRPGQTPESKKCPGKGEYMPR